MTPDPPSTPTPTSGLLDPGEYIDWSGCPQVESVPGKVSGVPVLKNTRVQADRVWINHAAGLSAEEIAEDFDLDFNDVQAVIDYARLHWRIRKPGGRGRTPMVLDENLLEAKEPLTGENGFHCAHPPRREERRGDHDRGPPWTYLGDGQSEGFHHCASQFDFSVIDTTQVSKEPQVLAEMIARAWVDYHLKSQHPAFCLKVQPNGQHEIRTDL